MKRKHFSFSDYSHRKKINEHGYTRPLATASGAALGFISGNVPGAILGAAAGYDFATNSSSVVSRNKMRSRANVKDETGAGQYTSSSRKIGFKKVKQAKKPSAHVTKQFKAKVQKAMLGQNIMGYLKNTFLGGYWNNFNVDSAQNIFDGDGYIQNTNTGPCVTPWSFTMLQFRQAANQLFAAQPAANTAAGLTYGNGFPWQTLRFKVLRCSSKYFWRNNSQHTINLKIYEVKPKRVSGYNPGTTAYSTLNYAALAATADPEAYPSPVTVWATSLAADVGMASELTGTTTPNVHDLHRNPTSCKSLQKQFALALNEVVLEPGQSHELFVNGPSNVEIDFEKAYKDGQLMDIQKFSRSIIGIVYPTLLGSTLSSTPVSAFGRFNDSGFGEFKAGFAVPVERIDQYQIIMPEETLGVTATGTGSVAFNRKPVRQENIYFASKQGITVDVLESNPVVPVS